MAHPDLQDMRGPLGIGAQAPNRPLVERREGADIGGSKANRRVLFVLFFAFSLLDVYVAGIRPLDFLALGLMVVLLYIGHQSIRKTISIRKVYVIYFILILSSLYSVAASFDQLGVMKISMGFFIGIFVFFYFLSASFSAQEYINVTKYIILVNSFFLVFQFVLYQFLGVFVNPLSIIGLEARAFSAIFRPTGLYLEPATYSVIILLTTMLRIVLTRRFDKYFYLACFTACLSLSFWGIGISAVLLLMSLFAKPLRALIVLSIAVPVVAMLFSFEVLDPTYLEFMTDRFSNLGSDGSANARYFAIFGGLAERSDWGLLFGIGMTNFYHDLGSNGLGFLMSAGGVIGVVAFTTALSVISGPPMLLAKLLFFAIALTAAPLWNTFFWWMWLAVVFKRTPRSVTM